MEVMIMEEEKKKYVCSCGKESDQLFCSINCGLKARGKAKQKINELNHWIDLIDRYLETQN